MIYKKKKKLNDTGIPQDLHNLYNIIKRSQQTLKKRKNLLQFNFFTCKFVLRVILKKRKNSEKRLMDGIFFFFK